LIILRIIIDLHTFYASLIYMRIFMRHLCIIDLHTDSIVYIFTFFCKKQIFNRFGYDQELKVMYHIIFAR